VGSRLLMVSAVRFVQTPLAAARAVLSERMSEVKERENINTHSVTRKLSNIL
jgi:hypothetical protein